MALTDKIAVLIEKYNPNPETPLKGDRFFHYFTELIIDGEKVKLIEEHSEILIKKGLTEKRRQIEIRVGSNYYKSLSCNLTTAILKVIDNGKNHNDSELESAIEHIGCSSYDNKVKNSTHQMKCLKIGMDIINELYNLPKAAE